MRFFLSLLLLFTCSYSEVIKSASELDYPPYSIVTNGQADGFAVELLRASLKSMNYEVSFYVDSWAKVKQDLEEGKIDVLPLVWRTPDREKVFDFSIPYLVMHGAIIVRKDNQAIHSFEDLNGKSILVMQDDNAEEFLKRENKNYNLIATKSYEEALRRLASGYEDAVVVQQLVGVQLIKKLGLTNLKVVPSLIKNFRQDFSFAVKEGDKNLLAKLNEGLSIVMASGEYDALYQKWLTPLEYEKRYSAKIFEFLSIVLGIVSALFILSVLWHKSLRKEVQKKTLELEESQNKLQTLNQTLENRIQDALKTLKEKDKLMVSQSRQAAMGEMISMIAHQWRQPLTVISMIMNNLRLDVELEEKLSKKKILESVENITMQVAHLSTTIDDFRDFFKTEKEKQTITLQNLIEEALKIVGASLKNHNVKFEIAIENNIEITIYKNEFIQVLINLINNAKDAVSTKGDGFIKFETTMDENILCFNVIDNGSGIDSKVASRLGEPYVSTKSLTGTGLGIYMSKIIIEKHLKGSLKWTSTSAGATFSICFPLSEVSV